MFLYFIFSHLRQVFDKFEKFIRRATSDSVINRISYEDLRDFGLKNHLIDRIGYMIIQLEAISPRYDEFGHSSIDAESIKSDIEENENYEEDFERIQDSDNNSSSKTKDRKLTIIKKPITNRFFNYSDEETDVKTNIHQKDKRIVTKRSSEPKNIHRRYEEEIFSDCDSDIGGDQPSPMKAFSVAPPPSISTKRPQSMTVVKKDVREMESNADIERKSISAGNAKTRKRPTAWIEKRQWKIGEKIGSGSFGDVFMGLNDMVTCIY